MKEIDDNLISQISESLYTIIMKWIKYLQEYKTYSHNTVRAYKVDLRSFIDFLVHYLGEVITTEILTSLSVKDIRSWLAFRVKNNTMHQSNKRAVSTIRTFYSYLFKEYNIDNSAVFLVKITKASNNLPKALSVENALSAIESIKNSQNEVLWVNYRNYAILLLLYGTGIRISEALNLKKSSFNNKDKLIKILGKGNKERIIPVMDIIITAINSYLDICPFKIELNGNIFLGVNGNQLNPDVFRKKIRDLRLEHNLPSFTSPHAFRHSFATHLLNNDVDIRIIQKLLGHTSLNATEKYTKINTQTIIDDYLKYHPRSQE